MREENVAGISTWILKLPKMNRHRDGWTMNQELKASRNERRDMDMGKCKPEELKEYSFIT